jgi:hypothetical protein
MTHQLINFDIQQLLKLPLNEYQLVFDTDITNEEKEEVINFIGIKSVKKIWIKEIEKMSMNHEYKISNEFKKKIKNNDPFIGYLDNEAINLNKYRNIDVNNDDFIDKYKIEFEKIKVFSKKVYKIYCNDLEKNSFESKKYEIWYLPVYHNIYNMIYNLMKDSIYNSSNKLDIYIYINLLIDYIQYFRNERLKDNLLDNHKYIFVTNNQQLSIKMILKNISVFNLLNSKINFISINYQQINYLYNLKLFKKNTIKFFEDISINPFYSLYNNIKLKDKYFQNIKKVINDLINFEDIKTLIKFSKLIKNEKEFIYCVSFLKYYLNNNKDQFKYILKKTDCFIINIYNNLFKYKKDFNKEISIKTYQNYFVFYGAELSNLYDKWDFFLKKYPMLFNSQEEITEFLDVIYLKYFFDKMK